MRQTSNVRTGSRHVVALRLCTGFRVGAERLGSETAGNKKAASVLRLRPGVRSTEDQAAAGRRRRTAGTLMIFTWAVMLRLLSEEVIKQFFEYWVKYYHCSYTAANWIDDDFASVRFSTASTITDCVSWPWIDAPHSGNGPAATTCSLRSLARSRNAGNVSPYGCAANHCDRGALPFRKSTKSDKSAIARKMTSVVS